MCFLTLTVQAKIFNYIKHRKAASFVICNDSIIKIVANYESRGINHTIKYLSTHSQYFYFSFTTNLFAF